MKKMLIMAVALTGFSTSVFAEETIVKERHEEPGVAIKVPTPGVVVKEKDHDCSSKTVHRENGEGDSRTVTKSNCD